MFRICFLFQNIMSLVFVIFNESLLIIYKISTEHIVVYNVVSSAYQIILKISVKDRSLIYILNIAMIQESILAERRYVKVINQILYHQK